MSSSPQPKLSPAASAALVNRAHQAIAHSRELLDRLPGQSRSLSKAADERPAPGPWEVSSQPRHIRKPPPLTRAAI